MRRNTTHPRLMLSWGSASPFVKPRTYFPHAVGEQEGRSVSNLFYEGQSVPELVLRLSAESRNKVAG